MMVFVLKKCGNIEVHIDVVKHPDSIDWIKCKDTEEAQKVVDYREIHKSIGAPISVNNARELYLDHLEAGYNTEGNDKFKFVINEQGGIGREKL